MSKQKLCAWEEKKIVLCAQAQDELSELGICLEKMRAEEKLLSVTIPALQERSDASGKHIVCLQAEFCRLTASKQELCAQEAQTKVLCAQAQDKLSKLATRIEKMWAEEKLLCASIPALQTQSDDRGEHIVCLEAETCRLRLS